MPRYKIKYFNPQTQIKPNTIMMFIGRRGMGKTTTMLSIIRESSLKFDIMIGMSPTHSSCVQFEQMGIPPTLIYDDLNTEVVERVLDAATHCTNQGKKVRIALILDDCAYDSNMWKSGSKGSTSFRKLMMNGRHLSITVFISVQYCMMVPMSLRNSIDYVFAHRETIPAVKKRLHTFFFGLIESRKEFSGLMDKLTQNRETLVLDNTQIQSTDVEECMFVYKATPYTNRVPGLVSPAVQTLHRRFYDRSCNNNGIVRTVNT